MFKKPQDYSEGTAGRRAGTIREIISRNHLNSFAIKMKLKNTPMNTFKSVKHHNETSTNG
jgi:hypothetical protein